MPVSKSNVTLKNLENIMPSISKTVTEEHILYGFIYMRYLETESRIEGDR
jgi:hypothetical protein